MKGADLQRTIIELFLYDGWLVLRPNSGTMEIEGKNGNRFVTFIRWYALGYDLDNNGGANTKGVADVLAFHPMRKPLACEVKGEGDTVKPEQEAFLEAWEQAGGESVVAWAVDDIAHLLVRTEVQ